MGLQFRERGTREGGYGRWYDVGYDANDTHGTYAELAGFLQGRQSDARIVFNRSDDGESKIQWRWKT